MGRKPGGKKTGGRDWNKTDNPPPRSKGCPPLSSEAKELKKLTASEYIERVNKYLYMTKEQLKAGLSRDDIEVLDLYIRNSLIKGIEKGDYGQLDKMLDRIIGKVKMEMSFYGNLNTNVNNKTEIAISDEALAAIGDAIIKATTEGS